MQVIPFNITTLIPASGTYYTCSSRVIILSAEHTEIQPWDIGAKSNPFCCWAAHAGVCLHALCVQCQNGIIVVILLVARERYDDDDDDNDDDDDDDDDDDEKEKEI